MAIETRASLEAKGYEYSKIGKCSKCPAQIQWYVTPKGSWTPMNMPDAEGKFETHWATCPAAKSFKRNK